MDCFSLNRNIKIELDESEICCKNEDFFHDEIKNNDGGKAHKRKYTDENDIKEEKNTEHELSNLKNSGFKFHHRYNPRAIYFTEEEARELIADCVGKQPKHADLPKEPGSTYVEKFIQAMPNLCSSESDEEEFKETAAKKIKKRMKKKVVGYNGKPLPDSCLIENYEWLFQDEQWTKKNRHPVLKTPVAKRLKSCVEAGEEITKEVVAELEALADHQVSATATTTVLSAHRVSTATTKVLLPGEVPLNNLILRVALEKLEL